MRDPVHTIKSLAALANDPGATPAERENALRKLEGLMQKHGVTVEQLAGVQYQRFTFGYATEADRRLLNQLAAVVIGSQAYKERPVYRYRRGKSLLIEMTPAEAVDLRILYDHYRPLLRQALKDVVPAFIARHALYPDDAEVLDTYDMTDAEYDALMRQKALQKALPESEDPLAHRRLPAGQE